MSTPSSIMSTQQQKSSPTHAGTTKKGTFFQPATIQRQVCNTPYDKALVERSKKKLALLEPKLQVLQGQRSAIDIEKLRVADDRRRFNESGDDPPNLVEQRKKIEENFIANINRKPIEVSVTDDAVIMHVKFQVFFSDPSMQKQFDQLKKTIQTGINLVWNQPLGQGVLANRKFIMLPDVVLIDSLAKRSDDFWLIEVRASDKSKVVHTGCSLPQPDPGTPTSVTDPLCDNGLISIPPSHISNTFVIGHEIIHLFGLVDRYVMFTEMEKGKQKVTFLPLRETRGRKDSLGGADGPILPEDLGYIFNRYGVYDKERQRSDPQVAYLEPEVARLREIIRLGCDPNSLIPTRKDFTDKMIKDAEDQ